MPGYKAHLTGGAIAGSAALGTFVHIGSISPSPTMAAALMALVLLGTLFPDTDTHSKGQDLFYTIMVLVDGILILHKEYQWAALLGLFAMLPALGKHRGWTHSWWAIFMVPLPIVLLPMFLFETPWESSAPFYCAAVLGYATHLVMDRLF